MYILRVVYCNIGYVLGRALEKYLIEYKLFGLSAYCIEFLRHVQISYFIHTNIFKLYLM